MTLSGNHVTLYVDCVKLYEQIIQNVDRIPPSSDIQLFLGQRNRQHALFRVSIEPLGMYMEARLHPCLIFACLALVIFGECMLKKRERLDLYSIYLHVDVKQLM